MAIELSHDKIKEVIESVCDHIGEKGFDKVHTAVALRCILRTLEKEGIEIQIQDNDNNESMQ